MLHLLLFYPSTWYSCDFFLFHIEIEGKCGRIIGGGKGYVAPPPSKIIGGGGCPPSPLPLFLRLCWKAVMNSLKYMLFTLMILG